jgi:hypothetical protein
MEITKALQELAKFSTDRFPVISIYLNPHWHDAHACAQSATFLRHRL